MLAWAALPAFAAEEASLPTVAHVLQAYHSAVAPTGALAPDVLEESGTLSGAALQGNFHSWHSGEYDRFDQSLGVRMERTLKIGDHHYEENSSGDVHEVKGYLLRRARTQDFIGSSDLWDQPQYSKLIGRHSLEDGRDVYEIDVMPPGGETETIFVDAHSSLIDRLQYVDGDGLLTADFSEYAPVKGYLFPMKSLESDGDHAFDITQIVDSVHAGGTIPASVFAPFAGSVIQSDGPVTVPIEVRDGNVFTDVVIHDHHFRFLVDSGAQGVVLNRRIIASLGIVPQGALEARGAKRTGGLGVAQLDVVHLGAATLPVRVVSVLDLDSSTHGALDVDGILGYPLFAAASVRIDYGGKTMTLAAPGGLKPDGIKLDVDVDRELPEIQATVNGVNGTFLVDTGNANELLVYRRFVEAHAGLVPFGAAGTSNFGVGGSTISYPTTIDELDVGPFRLFHRNTTVIMSDSGAFADRYDAGDIGSPVLSNFIVTFDDANRALYLRAAPTFDDGRDRRVFT
ncbi:MAG: aspartyl protease family protein [Candidatus Eremiobacteraeota bacterium]|nr:aspartyl protease family protein [Candidatus Eremiobacteraeota bacterium]